MGVSMDYDSVVNQEIKRKFVGRDVYCCVTTMVEDLLKHRMDEMYEEIENVYPVFTPVIVSKTECENCKSIVTEIDEDTGCCESCFDDNKEPQEVFEWWAVSEFLYLKLKERGYPVIEYGCTHIWGRTCTGQAILLDHVISVICEEMGILEGQQYDWSK